MQRALKKIPDPGTVAGAQTSGEFQLSWLLRGAQKNFADEASRGLGEDHCDGVGNVLGLEHLERILAAVRRKISGHRSWAHSADANAMRAEILCHTFGQPQ